LIFMAGPPHAPLIYRDAGQLVERFGLRVAPVMLPERGAFHHSVGAGRTAPEIEPYGKAAQDVATLWAWTCEHVNVSMRARQHVSEGDRQHEQSI
jgi:chromosome partitioning protein